MLFMKWNKSLFIWTNFLKEYFKGQKLFIPFAKLTYWSVTDVPKHCYLIWHFAVI